MRTIITIFLLIIFSISLNAQNDTIFKIIDSSFSLNFDSFYNSLLEKENPIFFEDSIYIVRKTCSGEWGGSVWFKNKKTGIEYSCKATCPLAAYKVKGKYYIINNLNHLASMGNIIEIDNPKNMEVFKTPKPINKKGKRRFLKRKNKDRVYYAGDFQSKYLKGVKTILDTIGVSIVASFKKDSSIYVAIQNYDTTSLYKLFNDELVLIQQLPFIGHYFFDNMIQTKENKTIIFFRKNLEKGFIEIIDNKISIYRTINK